MVYDNSIVLASIRCITYNQIDYIRQCLESLVCQQTTFKYEIIVHDDASTDGTTEIVKEYATRYPNLITPIIQTENQYSKHDGSIGRTLEAATNSTVKYVAYCEGDDFWMDPQRLQKQVDFLETHPNHSMVFNAVQYLYPDGRVEVIRRYDKTTEECPVADFILGGGGFIKVNSIVYRKELRYDYPEWAKNSPVGDSPFFLVMAIRGKVAYIDDLGSCYRVSAKGSWTTQMAKRTFKQRYRDMKDNIAYWNAFDEWSERKYHKYVRKKNISDVVIFCKSTVLRIIRHQ